jgi:hypothetical protein
VLAPPELLVLAVLVAAAQEEKGQEAQRHLEPPILVPAGVAAEMEPITAALAALES